MNTQEINSNNNHLKVIENTSTSAESFFKIHSLSLCIIILFRLPETFVTGVCILCYLNIYLKVRAFNKLLEFIKIIILLLSTILHKISVEG